MNSNYNGATVSLSGLFVEEDNEENTTPSELEQFTNEKEIVEVKVGDISIRICQMSWHMANANQIWPGAFKIAEHILQTQFHQPQSRYCDGKALELGAATGALAIALTKHGNFDIITRFYLGSSPFWHLQSHVFLTLAISTTVVMLNKISLLILLVMVISFFEVIERFHSDCLMQDRSQQTPTHNTYLGRSLVTRTSESQIYHCL